MIDRKLLKTNRWFDEEFLHARMTNACFNGGGGGDGGADDDEAYEGEAMRDHEERYGGDAAESQAIEQQIAAQAAAQAQAQAQAQAAAAAAARTEQTRQRAVQIEQQRAQQQAQDQHVAAQASAAAASRAAQQAAQVARQQGANQQEQEMAAQSAAARVSQDVVSQVDSFSGAPSNRTGFTAREQERFFDPVVSPAGTDFFGQQGSPTAPIDFSPTQQGHPDFRNSAGIFGTGVEDFSGMNDHAMRDIALGPTFSSDYATTAFDAPTGPASTAPLVNQEGRFDRFGNAIKGMFGMPNDAIYGIDTFTEIDPTTGDVHHSDGRITSGTTGQTLQEPTRDWNAPWYSNMPQWGGGGAPQRGEEGGGDDRGVDPVDGRVKPITDFIGRPPPGGPPGGPPVRPPVGPPGGPPGGPGFPPGGGGGYPPWYPPGGGGGMWPPGGGGGYPGGGGRTGGGMPGYMPNYPIHSQNLFNFTPARAMPGIDPSYQPWMQPAQGMDQNLWNYQAPNLVPWDMTNRVPWNFANTPTGQYGPMVATVGGEPAERGDR